MSERTYGYMIRWPVSNGYEYQGMHTTPNSDIQRAEVMSLAVASRFLRGGSYESAQIVRVRRVECGETWVEISADERNQLRFVNQYRTVLQMTYDVGIERRTPAAPRWEIDPEDEP